MSAAVLALAVLALAVLATFTPPQGWIPDAQLLQQMQYMMPVEWHQNRNPRLNLIMARLWSEQGYTADEAATMMGAKDERFWATPRGIVIRTQLPLCGSPGDIVTQRIATGIGAFISELVIESVNGALYALVYNHLGNGDPAAERFVRTACPASLGSLASLRAPPGWTMKPLPHIAAAWSGPNEGDSIEEITGPRFIVADWANAPYLEQMLGDPRTASAKTTISKRCGDLKREETFSVVSYGRTIYAQSVYLRTSSTDGYALIYKAYQPLDPNVMEAVRTFCPT